MAAPIQAIDANIVTGIVNSMQSMEQTLMGLQQTVLKLITDKSEPNNKTNENSKGNSLSSAYAALRKESVGQATASSATTPNATGGYRFPISEFGVPLECIPHVDIVSDVLKKKIWEGKDINLAALLIPKFDDKNHNEPSPAGLTVNLNQEDSRLAKSLNISEFITAFGKYKRMMYMKFPEKRVELDRYEANIVDISNVYGGNFTTITANFHK